MVWFQDRILAKIDKDFLDEILAEWGVGKVSFFKAVSGWQNLGILVKVKKRDLLLRIFRPRKWAKEKIYLELELANHLKNKGLPAAQVFKTKEGKILALRRIARANLPIALMEFLPGVCKFDFSDKEIVTSASLLGRVHFALRDFSSPHKAMKWYALPHLALLKREMKISHQDGGLIRLFNKDFGLMFRTFKKYKVKLLPRTLIHDDFHFANLLFSDSKISGVFDFDAARFATPLWDLAIFLGNVKIQFWEHQGRDFPIRKLQRLILDGYLSEAKLEKEETLLLSYLVRLFFWQKVAWAKKEITAGNLWARQVLDWSILALKEKF
jgi:Ser/Thr protein kinase RdoA (MazF antagonist)